MQDYKILFKKYRKDLFNYKENSFFVSIYRLCAIVIFPIFKNLNPNLMSYLGLLLGFIALPVSYFFEELSLNIIIIFFLLSFIIDHADGLIARYQKTTSFHGRFIDGLFGVLVGGFLHLVLVNYLYNTNNNFFNINFYYITILLLPIQHLILDRFSALARWCNEISRGKKIKPYLRNKYFNRITSILWDSEHLCIFLFLFPNFIDVKILIEVFLLSLFLHQAFL